MTTTVQAEQLTFVYAAEEGSEVTHPHIEVEHADAPGTPRLQPGAALRLNIHENGPDHGNYGIDTLVSVELSKQAVNDLELQLGEWGAEVMLLDWLSDAEMGEPLFGVLQHLDAAMEQINKLFGSDALAKPANTAESKMWRELVEARRMQAAILRWIDEVCVREGRPPLASYEKSLIAE